MISAPRRTGTCPTDLLTEDELLVLVHDHADARARELMLDRGMALVRHIAQRYDRRGIDHEEIVQVGSIGLIKAVDRFDPGRGLRFSTFAVPNIAGEIRRHFRDHGWAIRVTRSLQENALRVSSTTDELTTTLQRHPTHGEVAAASGLTVDQVLEALAAARVHGIESLDASLSIDSDAGTRGDLVGLDDHGYDEVDARLMVAAGLRCLQVRERRILQMRFERGMVQSDIAAELGISQMHVSRLLADGLARVRHHLEHGTAVATAA